MTYCIGSPASKDDVSVGCPVSTQDSGRKETIRRSSRFWTGIILLVIGPFFTWGGVVIWNTLAIRTMNKVFFSLAAGTYVVSWGIFVLGLLLAGPEGLRYSKILLRKMSTRGRRLLGYWNRASSCSAQPATQEGVDRDDKAGSA